MLLLVYRDQAILCSDIALQFVSPAMKIPYNLNVNARYVCRFHDSRETTLCRIKILL